MVGKIEEVTTILISTVETLDYLPLDYQLSNILMFWVMKA